jgi:putative selenium metabolism hydrolase
MQNHVIAPDVVETLWRGAEELREPLVGFTRRLIQTPSLPGYEGDVAALIVEEMQTLGYDDVQVDEAGNVIGHIRANVSPVGERPRRSIMFNAHMDHVDVGDPSRWPFPPYEATVHEGHIWGRGTSDLKGSLACQVWAGALLKRLDLPLHNDIYVVGVVQEEVGGLGSATLARHLHTDYAVIGEPSANVLALGHRGRTEMLVTMFGKSVHASVPESGVNPLYSMARFLQKLEGLRYDLDPKHPYLGPTTVAPTLINTDQTSPNVVPAECKLVLDIRNAPADPPDLLLSRVRELLDASLEDGASGEARINAITLKSYRGVTGDFSNAAPPFGIAPDSALAVNAQAVLSAALKRRAQTKIWPFCTDAGHLVAAGITVIGFGPGHEDVIHTVNERISIDEMVEAVVANAALAIGLT